MALNGLWGNMAAASVQYGEYLDHGDAARVTDDLRTAEETRKTNHLSMLAEIHIMMAMAEITTTDKPLIVIEPDRGWRSLGLREVWAYRELLVFMTWRTLKARYKQTVLGMLWAVIQPVMTMVVFTIFFGGLAKIPSDGVPYPIFSFTALVPWAFFSGALANIANSIVQSGGMIRKIYFPRLIMPLSMMLSEIVDFALAFLVLVAMLLYFIAATPALLLNEISWLGLDMGPAVHYGIRLSANVIWLIPLFLLAMITALGIGLWLAALNVQFRDVRHSIGFILRLWLFITPIAYPSSMISEEWRLVYALNPMAGVIEGFRWALLGTNTAPGPMILIAMLVSLTLLIGGLFFFRRMEKHFADVL
jgi:lipopolysaccharide transport system permease protein